MMGKTIFELVHPDDRERTLRMSLARVKREKTILALLFIDLDKFKAANDTFGHTADDEFVVLREGISNGDNVSFCAEKIRGVFDSPFEISLQNIQISPGIGVALYPVRRVDETQSLKYAGERLYGAKKQGGNRAQLKSASTG